VVQCEICTKAYHAACVFFGLDNPSGPNRFTCPLCCLRKNLTYHYSQVRVKPIGTFPHLQTISF
jgi:histone demethylase JARID1